MAKKKADSKSKELLERIRRRYKIMVDADRENRQNALEDLKFLHVPGEQWDAWTRRERGNERPMYEFNKTRITVKRIVNDMRANRPAGKVRAVEDGDKPTANVLEGLIRNIWNTADGDTVIDQAGEYQVGAGMGAWRVTTRYADDEAFEQVIDIEAIRNPFCLYADPGCEDILKRDATDWALTSMMSEEQYESRWPNREVISFEADTEFDDEGDWREDKKVRVCEYWWKEPVNKTLCLLGNGMTVDKSDPNITPELIAQAGGVLKERAVRSHKIMMCIAAGDSVLEGPTEWAGSMFPFVMIYGEHIVIDGKTYWFGLTRFAKDAQRSYNVSRTNAIESVALTPQAKFWATPEQALGHTAAWAEANRKNFPFQLYNPDVKAPGAPQRMGSADVPVALIEEMRISSEDIKAVTGIYDASLGAQSNETSGKAINARQRQGEIATFNYMDNMAKGIRRTWEIMIDLVPKIYDTARTVRILGVDGAEDYTKINTVDEQGNALNDLTRGKYDVAITVGPSFATLRQEAAEAYGEIAARDPNVMAAAGDLVFKAMDLPYAEQIAERYQALLPPPIQQLIGKGKSLPPEAQAAMAQAEQAMAMVQQQSQLVQQAAAEIEQKGADLTKQIAALDVKRAQFDADVEKKMAQIMKAEAGLILKQAQAGADQEGTKLKSDRESLSAEVQSAVSDIQKLAVEFQQAAVQTLSQIQAQAQPGVIVANPPKRKSIRVKRVNGELIGESLETIDGV